MADAGVVTRNVFGTLFLILGIVVLVGGIAAFAFGTMDEQENQDQTFPDDDRTAMNNALVSGGMAAVALGFAITIIGTVMVTRGNKNKLQLVTEDGLVLNALPPKKAKKEAAKIQAKAKPKGDTIGPASPTTRKGLVGLAVAVVGAIVVLGIFVLATAGDDGLFNGGSPRRLGDETQTGTIAAEAVLPVVAPSHSTSGATLDLPAGTKRVEVLVTWTPADNGPTTLDLSVWQNQGGTDRLVTSGAGTEGIAAEWLVDASGEFHFELGTSDNHVAEQSFEVQWIFWSS